MKELFLGYPFGEKNMDGQQTKLTCIDQQRQACQPLKASTCIDQQSKHVNRKKMLSKQQGLYHGSLLLEKKARAFGGAQMMATPLDRFPHLTGAEGQ